MLIEVMKSKIHRAVVTDSNLNYVGSITIDQALLKSAGLYKNQKVQIVNNNNGNRFETYIIEAPANSGMVCLNGAAARMALPGDIIIIIGYGMIEEQLIEYHHPKVVFVDEQNNVTCIGDEVAGD